MLYDWGGGKFFPISVNDGFKTVIHMMADEDQRFSPPSLVSARVPAVRLLSRLGWEESPVEQYIYSSAEETVSGWHNMQTQKPELTQTINRVNSNDQSS